MSNPQMLPERSTSFADQPHAYDPVAQPQLFAGVIGKRSVAFIIDAVIIVSRWYVWDPSSRRLAC